MQRPAMMYDPCAPNQYAEVVADLKRRRVERAVLNQIKYGVAAPVAAADAPSLAAPAAVGAKRPDIASLSTADLLKQRRAMAAAAGVVRAQHDLTDAEAAENRAKVTAGEDTKSRMRNLLDKLSAAKQTTSAQSTGDASNSGGPEISHLEYHKTASGSTVLSAATAQKKKPPVTGKPSACVLLRNLVARGAADAGLCAEVAAECAKFGVVKDLQAYELPKEECLDEAEAVRIFVRFDSVATAFKASEALNGVMFDQRMVVVCFFPTPLVEARTLGPQAHEKPLAALL